MSLAITYNDGTEQRIYAFYVSLGELRVCYKEASQWKHAFLGQPPGTKALGQPNVVTYRQRTDAHQQIVAFVRGANGHLYANQWNGSEWIWVNQGSPSGTTLAVAPADDASLAPDESQPSVITFRESIEDQRIYVFAQGANGRLYVNYRKMSQWAWSDLGPPPPIPAEMIVPLFRLYNAGTGDHFYTISASERDYAVSEAGYNDEGTACFVYMFGGDNELLRLYNPTSGDHFYTTSQDEDSSASFQGYRHEEVACMLPSDVQRIPTADFTPGAITYRENTQRLYAFLRGNIPQDFDGGHNCHLYLKYWNGTQWKWRDQGVPPGTTAVFGQPGVVTYREGAQPEQIHAFICAGIPKYFGGQNILDYQIRLYVNHWNGSDWEWRDQGAPPTKYTDNLPHFEPEVLTFRDGTEPQRIYAFVKRRGDDHIWVNFGKASQMGWADLGSPLGLINLAGRLGAITFRTDTKPREIYVFAMGWNGAGDQLSAVHWDGLQWKWQVLPS